MSLVENKVSLITGAGSGIGKATAVAFANDGAQVVCADLNFEAAQETAATITNNGGTSLALQLDVSDYSSAGKAVDDTVKHFGRLDVLCNIAGIGKLKHDKDETPELWHKIISVNLTGTFYMCQHALPHLLASKGNIVNCSSRAGTSATPWSAAYSASKGGVCALTRSMAVSHVYQGLRVNCIAPGPTDTAIATDFMPPEDADRRLMAFIIPLEKVAHADELANAFVFLASDRASNINGVTLPVDGGSRA